MSIHDEFSEKNVRETCRKRSCTLLREMHDGAMMWVVQSDTGLCEIVSTLRDAHFATLTLGGPPDARDRIP